MLDEKVPGGFKAAGSARRLLDRLDGVVESSLLEDIRFLVNELVTNSVRHGRVGATQEIRIRVTRSPAGLRTEVHDPGPGFLHVPRTPAMDEGAGWGLHILERIADRWGITRVEDKTCVWFEIDGPPERLDQPRPSTS